MDITSYLLGKKAGGGSPTPPSLQEKNVTITENTTTNVLPDIGYDGLSKVSITTNVSGGGGDLDWSAIGYDSTPQEIVNHYNYAKDIYDNWDSSVTSLNSKFNNNKNLYIMPLVDTSNVTTMRYIFQNCTNLYAIPVLNTSKLTYSSDFQGIFNYTNRSYSNEFLDNVLQMCINATSYTGTKTLQHLGLNSNYNPVSRIETLPHYQDFIDAGWTIGY